MVVTVLFLIRGALAGGPRAEGIHMVVTVLFPSPGALAGGPMAEGILSGGGNCLVSVPRGSGRRAQG